MFEGPQRVSPSKEYAQIIVMIILGCLSLKGYSLTKGYWALWVCESVISGAYISSCSENGSARALSTHVPSL